MHSLKSFGFPVELRDLLVSFDASKVSVFQRSSLSLDDLCTAMVLSTNAFKLVADESHEHWVWHENIFAVNILRANLRFIAAGGDAAVLPRFVEGESVVGKGLQKAVHDFLRQGSTRSSALVLRDKLRNRLARWKLHLHGLHLNHATNRALSRLQALHGKAQPSVAAVYLRTLLNGWVTGRRMRSLADSGLSSSCVFCSNGDDSLEHFVYCSPCSNLFHRKAIRPTNCVEFLALDSRSLDDPSLLVRKAKCLAVLYLAHNSMIHSECDLSVEHVIAAAENMIF